MYRKIIFLAVILLFALPHAHADEASKRAKVEQMFILMKMDARMQQAMEHATAGGKEAAKGLMGGMPMTSEDKKIMDDYIAKIVAAASDALSWEKLKPAYVELYASAYSEEEVDGILAFYRSPVGHALLAKSPELIAKSGAIMNTRMQELGPQLQEIMADLQKQLQVAHSDKTPAK